MAAQAKSLTALRTRANVHFHLSIERGNVDLRAEGRFPRCDRQLDLDITVADDFEKTVRLESDMQVQIAGRRPALAGFFMESLECQ